MYRLMLYSYKIVQSFLCQNIFIRKKTNIWINIEGLTAKYWNAGSTCKLSQIMFIKFSPTMYVWYAGVENNMKHLICLNISSLFLWLTRYLIKYLQSGNSFTYPCKFPMRAQARKAGPPKKSFKSSSVILKRCH